MLKNEFNLIKAYLAISFPNSYGNSTIFKPLGIKVLTPFNNLAKKKVKKLRKKIL